jgi:hypothetical protein
MGFMDKVVSKARDVSEAGHAKVDSVQAKRQVDDLYRQIGSLEYAARSGRGKPEDAAQVEQAMTKLRELEEAQPGLFVPGSAVPTTTTDPTTSGPTSNAPATAGTAFTGGATERSYVAGAPAPAGLYPSGTFSLDELGYPKLSDPLGSPILADGTDASYDQLKAMGIEYPAPEDQRYWSGGIPSPWEG